MDADDKLKRWWRSQITETDVERYQCLLAIHQCKIQMAEYCHTHKGDFQLREFLYSYSDSDPSSVREVAILRDAAQAQKALPFLQWTINMERFLQTHKDSREDTERLLHWRTLWNVVRSNRAFHKQERQEQQQEPPIRLFSDNLLSASLWSPLMKPLECCGAG